MALSGNRLYAIHKSGDLVAIDLATGQTLEKMAFDETPEHIGSVPFWVVAQAPYLLVNSFFLFKMSAAGYPN